MRKRTGNGWLRGIWDRFLSSSPRRGWGGRRSRRVSRLLVEPLEGRLTPATLSATLIAGDLTITDSDSTGKDNILTVSVSGSDLVISDANETFESAPAGGTLSDGDRTLTIPLASVTGTLSINGVGGNDTCTVNALPGLLAGLTIIGGSGTDSVTFTSAVSLSADRSLAVDVSSTINLSSSAALTASGTGAVSLKAQNISLAAGSSITTAQGDITLVADNMDILSTVSGGGVVALRPHSTGGAVAIDLGGADAASTLGLTDDELDLVSADTLQIGNPESGSITISAPLTRPVSTNIELSSGFDIIISGGEIDTGGGTLFLDPNGFGSVKPTFTGTDVIASVVSFDASPFSRMTFQINGTGSQYTQLTVTGAVDLTGVLLQLSVSYTPSLFDFFTLVDNDDTDSITGTFLSVPEGTRIPNFVNSGLDGIITYSDGPGVNDGILFFTTSSGSSPPLISDQSFAVDENSAAGTVVGTVAATPAPPADSLTYAIIAGNTGGAFAIDPGTGELTVANQAALDFETNPTISLTVQVTDNFSSTSQATVTINLADLQTQLTINDVTLAEGDAGTTTFRFTLTSSAAINVPFFVTATTTDGSAFASAGDYDAGIGLIPFLGSFGGQESVFDVVVRGDVDFEGDENVFVDLIGVDSNDVTFAVTRGVGTILEDDQALLVEGASPGDVLVTATIGEEVSLSVGSFQPNFPVGGTVFVATINWGDGTTSSGDIAFDGVTQTFQVSGTHTYLAETTYLVSLQVEASALGLTAQVDAGAAVILTPGQTQQLNQSDFEFLPPGGGRLVAQTDNILALLVQPNDSQTPVTLFIAEFDAAPVPIGVVDDTAVNLGLIPSSFFDIRVTGATEDTTLTVTLKDDALTDARAARVVFFDMESKSFLPVIGSRIRSDSLVVDPQAGTVRIIFDATSFPTIFGLWGTVVAIEVATISRQDSSPPPVIPPQDGAPLGSAPQGSAPQGSVPQGGAAQRSAPVAVTLSTASIAPAIALASNQASTASSVSGTDSGAARASVVTFRTSSRVSVSVNATQDSARSGNAEDPTREVRPGSQTPSGRELEKLLEEVLKSLNKLKKYIPIPLLNTLLPTDPSSTASLPEMSEEVPVSPSTGPEQEAVLDGYFATPPDEGAAQLSDSQPESTPESASFWGTGLLALVGAGLQRPLRQKSDRNRRFASV